MTAALVLIKRAQVFLSLICGFDGVIGITVGRQQTRPEENSSSDISAGHTFLIFRFFLKFFRLNY